MVIIRIASKCAALMPHARILAPACTHTRHTRTHAHTRGCIHPKCALVAL